MAETPVPQVEPREAPDEPLAPANPPADPDPPARGFFAELLVTILFLLFANTLLLWHFVIPTSSMESTLMVGDYILVDKLTYAPRGWFSRWVLPFREVQRGDVMVFRYPVNPGETFVKRVIAVGGDHLKMVDKAVFVNGKRLQEPYAQFSQNIDSYRDNYPAVDASPGVTPRGMELLLTRTKDNEIVVPANCYFVLGDNRDRSLDSRYWGVVPRDHVVGKPLLIYWSVDAPSEMLLQPGVNLSHKWYVVKNFFSKTRWKRIGRLIHGHNFE